MKDIKPNYYRRTIHGVEIDVNDIADAFDLGYHGQNILKYVLRAGRKDEKAFVDDLVKARHYIDRLIKKHEDEAEKAEVRRKLEESIAECDAEIAAEEAAEKAAVEKMKEELKDPRYSTITAEREAKIDKAAQRLFGYDTETMTAECAQSLYEQIQARDQALRADEPTFGREEVVETMIIHPEGRVAYVQKHIVVEDNDGVVAKPKTAYASPGPLTCWIVTRDVCPPYEYDSGPDYRFSGPFPTREAARRALEPDRTDQRVVIADDPSLVPLDVIERLFA